MYPVLFAIPLNNSSMFCCVIMRNLQLSYLSTTYLLWLRNNLYPVLYENIIHKAITENFSLTEVQFYTLFYMRTLSTSLLQTTFHWLRYNFIPWSVKMFTLATFISMSDLLLCKKERQFCQVTLLPIYM